MQNCSMQSLHARSKFLDHVTARVIINTVANVLIHNSAACVP